MNLLIYTANFAPLRGGIETFVASLAGGLSSPATSVKVVTRTPDSDNSDEGRTYEVIRNPSVVRFARAIGWADIVQISGPALLPMIICCVMQKQFVVEHHGFQTVCPNGQLMDNRTQSPCPGYFMTAQHRQCLRCNASAGRIHSLKLWSLTFLRRFGCGFATANITPTYWLSDIIGLNRTFTIHHGLEQPLPASRRVENASSPNLVFLGRLVCTKGVSVLLRALDLLRNETNRPVHVNIIGDGPERARLEQQCRLLKLTDSVKFWGELEQGKLDQLLGEASAVVMPSLAGEVFGLVAAECMLHGLVVIASDIGALREVVGETGILFKTGDSKDLARCLKQIANHPESTRELGRQAKQRATKLFDYLSMVNRHLAIYRKCVGDATEDWRQHGYE